MSDVIKTGWVKVVKYINTPLHFYSVCFLGVIGLMFLSKTLNLPLPVIYILLIFGMLIFSVVTLFLIFSPKSLQFTAEEQIQWRKLELGDSRAENSYSMGEIPSEEPPVLLEDKRQEDE